MAWRDARAANWSPRSEKNESLPTRSAPACRWTRASKAASISPSVPAFGMESRTPFTRAASCTSLMMRSVLALFGFTSSQMVLASGTSSESSSKRLAVSSGFIRLMPVRLPPGRARLATSPSPSGSALDKDNRDRRGRTFGR